MQVQVADCTLCLVFVIFVKALGSIGAAGALDTCADTPMYTTLQQQYRVPISARYSM